MSQNANLIIERIKRKLDIKSNKLLCNMLDIKQNTLSSWKKRDTLDFNKIISFCEKNNLDLNEIFFPENDFENSKIIEDSTVNPVDEKPAAIQFDIKKIKQVNLVNSNKDLAFFSFQEDGVENTTPIILIGQRTQLKKVKVDNEVILVLNNKKVKFERVKSFSSDFSRYFFDSTLPHNTLSSVLAAEIKQAYISIGYLDNSEMKSGNHNEKDKLNQILLLEKQVQRLKKKFEK